MDLLAEGRSKGGGKEKGAQMGGAGVPEREKTHKKSAKNHVGPKGEKENSQTMVYRQ